VSLKKLSATNPHGFVNLPGSNKVSVIDMVNPAYSFVIIGSQDVLKLASLTISPES